MIKQKNKFFIELVFFLILCIPFSYAGSKNLNSISGKPGTNFYVNSVSGSDSNSGTTKQEAWKTLARVNEEVFEPGDSILFHSGSVFVGRLSPKGSGTPERPITISKYGNGNKPHIEAKGQYSEALLLMNVEYWNVSNLEISNKGKERAAGRAGVRLLLSNFGTAHHIHLSNLYIHDVNGSNVKSKGGGAGITWMCKGDSIKSRFDDLVIENCHLVRTDRNGITGSSAFWPRYKWYPSLHVVIKNNLLEDIGGDGIVPIACDSALIEYNVLHGGRQRANDYAAGIWPWSCDNTVIQYNEVSGMKGYKDGQGFDSDWNCRNTIIQYNYSHNNEGGFLLICDNGRPPDSINAGNVGTIVRYNISQNDGSRTFQIAGPVNETKIYNNSIFVGDSLDVKLFLFNSWSGWSNNTDVFNNIFYVNGKGTISHQSAARLENGKYITQPGYGKSKGNIFNRNVYFGNILNPPKDTGGLFQNPLLKNAGSGKNGRDSLNGYKLVKTSPCIGAGREISNNGNIDFWGDKLPSNSSPDIGAFQFESVH